MNAKTATQMSKSIKSKAGDSVIASLAGRTDTKTATAAKPAGLPTGNNFTGQYLYDRFITDDNAASISKMDIVRSMVAALDTQSFKTAVNDFVGVAKGFLDKAVETAKHDGTYRENTDKVATAPAEVVQAQARHKTAKNSQTVMRVAYGAIKHAPDQLVELGYKPGETGYQIMAVIGRKALEAAGLKWDGSPLETSFVKQQRTAQKEEAKALASVMDANPRRDDEDRAAYFGRIDKLVTKEIKAIREEKHSEQIAKLVAKFKADAGALLPEILDALLSNDGDQSVH